MQKYSWDDLYERAIGCACLSRELKAKDEARWELTCIIKEETGIDIDECEIPEEEIEHFLENADREYWFDEFGSLIEEE